MRQTDLVLPALLASLMAAPPAVQAQVAAGTAAGVQIGSAGGVHGPVELAAATHDTANRAIGHRLGSGEPIYQGDLIATGPGGGLQVLLLDQTVFSIGENARMTIDAMTFSPASGDGKIDFNVEQGAFRFVSGQIAAAHPENVTIRIPEGSIGIRGTIVGGSVGPEGSLVALLGPGSDNNSGARNGAIVISTPAGTVDLSRTGYATLIQPSQPPTPPAPLTPAQIQQLNRATAPSNNGADGNGGGSADTASGQATAAGQRAATLVTTVDTKGPPPGAGVINTGTQTKLAAAQLAPVSSLADYGAAALSALGVKAFSPANESANGEYYYTATSTDDVTTERYSFAYTANGISLTNLSSGDSRALTLQNSATDQIRSYQTSWSETDEDSRNNVYIFNVSDYQNTASLIYSTYGTWKKQDDIDACDGVDCHTIQFGVFATGVPTPLAQMPNSGSATYSGGAAGFATITDTNSQIYSLTGTSSLTANFSTGTISGTLTLSNGALTSNYSSLASVTVELATTSFKGGNTFSGSATSASLTSSSGSYSGAFYGTSAAEVAGTAQVSGTVSGGSATATITAAYGAKK